MRDHELYTTIVGLRPPWTVERVEVDLPGKAVHVWLGRPDDTPAPCPQCQAACPIYDHREREWRHLDPCQLQTRLHARVPRVQCPTHGVVQSAVPWATPGSQLTLLFARLVLDWLQEAAVLAVARQLQVGWDAVWGIKRRAVARGPGAARDAGAALRGRRREGVPAPARVRDGRERSRGQPRALRGRRPQAREPGRLLGVGVDGGAARGAGGHRHGHVGAVRPGDAGPDPDAEAKIVFDKFHCAQHLNDGVDRVRRAEHRELRARGDTRLAGTKYRWLRNPEHFDPAVWRAFGPLRRSTLKVARAWALKESAARLWEYRYVGAARTFFRRWYHWATHSRLQPMIEKARMLKTHLPNILTYLKHRITNATAEGLNSKIQWLRYTARGFRNRENFKTAIYFHCGGLDLYPH